MRGRRVITLVTVLATAATLALTGSVVGPVASSDASPGRYQWRADLDAASTAIPTAAQSSVQTQAKSLIRARASNTKATAVAAASTDCDGCSGEATTLQIVYFDGSGPVSADNVANAISQCSGCPIGVRGVGPGGDRPQGRPADRQQPRRRFERRMRRLPDVIHRIAVRAGRRQPPGSQRGRQGSDRAACRMSWPARWPPPPRRRRRRRGRAPRRRRRRSRISCRRCSSRTPGRPRCNAPSTCRSADG